MRAAVRPQSRKTKVTQNVRMELEGACSLSSLPVLPPSISAPVLQSHCKAEAPPTFLPRLAWTPYLPEPGSFKFKATDQVTRQQWTPTCLPKTETVGGEEAASSDLLPRQDLGSGQGGGIPQPTLRGLGGPAGTRKSRFRGKKGPREMAGQRATTE